MGNDLFSGENSVVFEIKGKKIEIGGLDAIFYSIYKGGVSSEELLKEKLIIELEKAGNVPADVLEEAAVRLMKIYRDNMERAGSINFG
jgi:hypothetical protein